jgi:hypothetical protein
MNVQTQKTVRRLPEMNVVGPYSEWPRPRPRRRARKVTLMASAAGAAAVFVHCAAPLLA